MLDEYVNDIDYKSRLKVYIYTARYLERIVGFFDGCLYSCFGETANLKISSRWTRKCEAFNGQVERSLDRLRAGDLARLGVSRWSSAAVACRLHGAGAAPSEVLSRLQ
jgi:hypothetical protein